MWQWSELPVNLLQSIEDRLVLYVDKVRVRAICMSWNSRLPKMPGRKDRQFPWLLQALDNNTEASHTLFNPTEKKFYLLDLPEAQGKLFKGSSHGWVATLEDKQSSSPTKIYLINLVTRARMELPSRNKFPDVRKYRADKVDQEYNVFCFDEGSKATQFLSSDDINFNYTDKVLLSSSPSNDDCVLVAIYGPYRRLAFCKLNDNRWKPLRLIDHMAGLCKTKCHFVDIIFHKGKLHALNMSGQVLVFENNGDGPYSNVTEIARELPRDHRAALTYRKYLVEGSDGGLIMVARYFHFLRATSCDVIPRTYNFRAFKLDSMNSSWVEVINIGDDILFLGLNSSLSISSRHFPGYKGNHIYFTDSIYSFGDGRKEQEDSDMGVFNLEDATLQSLPGLKCHPKFLWPPPVWVNFG